MSTLTRKDVTAMLGELDDDVIAEIIATGATPEELAEAHAWLANDESLMNAGSLAWSTSSPPSAKRKSRKTSQGKAERPWRLSGDEEAAHT